MATEPADKTAGTGVYEDGPLGVSVRIIKMADETDALRGEPVESRQETEAPNWLEPPYPIDALYRCYQNSTALRPCIDAYATNIDGFGHALVPRYSEEDVRTVLAARIESGADGAGEGKGTEAAPAGQAKRDRVAKLELDDAKVDAAYDAYVKDMDEEYGRLVRFFDYASVRVSFVELRKRTRTDLEISGNAYWEVARDEAGAIAKLYHAPGRYMRLMPLREEDRVRVDMHEQLSPYETRDVPVIYHFRRYQQIAVGNMKPIYFKEFGDKRVMSAATGAFFESADDLKAAEPGARAANEIIHFAIYSGNSAYGEPRWIGALRSVYGSIELDEVNWMYFGNKAIPPFVVLVAGSTLHDKSVKRIKERIKEHKSKGVAAFHDLLVLEAASDPQTRMVPKIELKPLTGDQQKDAIFQEFDQRNIEKISYAFRLPRLLRGDMSDFNRATANAAIEYAETQVFAGEREAFDWFMTDTFLAALGARYHRFRSNGPQVRDLENVAAPLEALARAGIVVPEEARRFVTENTSLDLPEIEEDWVKRPIQITMAGRGYEEAPGGAGGTEGVMRGYEREEDAR